MSLINQMLKDLDARRGPASGAQVAALQGIGLVHASRRSWYAGLRLAGFGMAALLALAAGYKGIGWWLDSREQPVAATDAVVAVPARAPIPEHAPDVPDPAEQTQAVVAAHVEAIEPVDEQSGSRAVKIVDAAIETTVETGSRAVHVASVEARRTKPAAVSPLSPQQQAQRVHAQAQQALADGQLDTARQLLERALLDDPYHVMARLQLATLVVDGGNRTEAEAVLAAGLRLHPRRLELARPYAQLLAERGALTEALRILDTASAGEQQDVEALALRGAILFRAGQFGEASKTYRLALEAEPGRGLWWVGLAVASENHDPLEALEAYRRAANLKLETGVRDYVAQRIAALASHYGSNGN